MNIQYHVSFLIFKMFRRNLGKYWITVDKIHKYEKDKTRPQNQFQMNFPTYTKLLVEKQTDGEKCILFHYGKEQNIIQWMLISHNDRSIMKGNTEVFNGFESMSLFISKNFGSWLTSSTFFNSFKYI